MDYDLYIIIPKKEIKMIKLNERQFGWGDSVYSLEPPQYLTDSNILFEQIEDVQYFRKEVGEEFLNDVITLHLISNVLIDLEYAINRDVKTLEQNQLIVFLNELFELSEFYVLLVREDEIVKERYGISSKEEINARLLDSLSWSNPKDVLLFKR